jgi:hypothetical protein
MNNPTVKMAMQYMLPQYVPVIKRLMSDVGLTEDALVSDVWSSYAGEALPDRERVALGALRGATVRSGISKFERKLTFKQQCEILALKRLGHTNEFLGAMYGIDRRTVTHMYNPTSNHYKAVREEEKRLGADRFLELYWNEELVAKLIAAEAVISNSSNNKSANRKKGLHIVQNDWCKSTHRVYIDWREPPDVQEAGWYYRDLDSDFPDDWLYPAGVPEAKLNSQACYDGMLEDITDPVPNATKIP